MPFREDAVDCNTVSTGSHQHLGFKRGMAIASLNINGLRSHHDEIKLLLNDQGIHILALNETKLDASVPTELSAISGYQQKRLDRAFPTAKYMPIDGYNASTSILTWILCSKSDFLAFLNSARQIVLAVTNI